jgi:hypothetical protein
VTRKDDVHGLADKLGQAGYYALFRLPNSEHIRAALWNEPGNPEAFVDLAGDVTQSWQPRFLASELIYDGHMFLLRPETIASLPGIYVCALEENYTGSMADWGFARDMNDPGTLGGRFVQFGRESVPVLVPLMDESREVPYAYPSDFPSEFRTGMRIKDFALLYLGLILGISLRLTNDPTQRDDEIRRVKSLLR